MRMHCGICFIWIVALATVVSAAGIRPIPSNDEVSLPLRGAYQEQDTARAFYSYGYSDENAARAEYTTRDGSSRGFYSYVDANGKLQTVRYEAGGRQGFKAEASNQPQAPVDDQKAPLPVTDTREVQEAREAHLNALRKAQKEQEQEEEEREKGQERGNSERALSDEDADILERVRAELTAMLAERQRAESPLDKEKQQGQEENDAVQQEQETETEQREEEDQRQQQRLRTVYTLEDINSSSYLKLRDRLDRTKQDLRVPTGAYYSYASPSAKYSVTTPTQLRTLRPVALSRSLLLSKPNLNQNQKNQNNK
ncbi:hypothetical protein ACLKA7_017508 [Drosophila subpalustris]